MSLNQQQTQALGSIADGLAGSDPRLASMLTIFSRLAAGEEMPARQNTRTRRRRPATPPFAPRPAIPAPGHSTPQARQLYPRLGRQQAMLVLRAVICAALLTDALAGHRLPEPGVIIDDNQRALRGLECRDHGLSLHFSRSSAQRETLASMTAIPLGVGRSARQPE